MININKIKLMLPKLHVMFGIGGDFVGADWSIDYSLNLDDEFNEDVAELGLAINFLSAAVRKSDLPAIMCALVRVRGAQILPRDSLRISWKTSTGLVGPREGGCAMCQKHLLFLRFMSYAKVTCLILKDSTSLNL